MTPTSSRSKYGFFASQCNGLAYNPNTTYVLPVTSTGTSYPAGTFTFPTPATLPNQYTITSAAPTIATGSVTVTINNNNANYRNGDVVTIYSNDNNANQMVGTVTNWNNNTQQVTVNVTTTAGSGTLTNPRIGDGDTSVYYYNYTGSQTKLDYTYSGNGVITTTTFYRECNSNVGSTPGSGVFTRVDVTPSSADLQNYRNWYTYYRTRILMMRSAASLAFQPINDRYRVGFSTIINQYVNGTGFLDVSDFNAGQKSSFYTALFGCQPEQLHAAARRAVQGRQVLRQEGHALRRRCADLRPGAVLLPAQLRDPDDRRLLERQRRDQLLRPAGPVRHQCRPAGRPAHGAAAVRRRFQHPAVANEQPAAIEHHHAGATADQHQHAADADARFRCATAAEHEHPAAMDDHRAVAGVQQHADRSAPGNCSNRSGSAAPGPACGPT